jgi:hypothetical protein
MPSNLSNYLRTFLQIYQRDDSAIGMGLDYARELIDCGSLSSNDVTSLLKTKNKKDQKEIKRKTLIELTVTEMWKPPLETHKSISTDNLKEHYAERERRIQEALKELGITEDELYTEGVEDYLKSSDLHALLAFDFAARLDYLVDFLERADETDYRHLQSVELKKLFQEAHICYLNGSFMATILMCGSVLEDALNLLYPDQKEDDEREDLINRAIQDRTLDDSLAKFLREIYEKRNKAAHEPSRLMGIDLKEVAKNSLLKTRLIIQNIFKPENSAQEATN